MVYVYGHCSHCGHEGKMWKIYIRKGKKENQRYHHIGQLCKRCQKIMEENREYWEEEADDGLYPMHTSYWRKDDEN